MEQRSIRVWDLPVRLFHWLLLVCVAGAVVSVKLGGGAMQWHGLFGQAIVGLIAFRLVWGVVGSTTARFASFVRPGAIGTYLKGRWHGIGHNPLGAFSVLALLGLVGFQAVSGLFTYDDISFYGPMAAMIDGPTTAKITGWHRIAEPFIYILVALHVGAVLFYTFVKKDSLVKPMITGDKRVSDPTLESTRGGGALAFCIALAIAVAVVWATSGVFNPPPPPPAPAVGW